MLCFNLIVGLFARATFLIFLCVMIALGSVFVSYHSNLILYTNIPVFILSTAVEAYQCTSCMRILLLNQVCTASFIKCYFCLSIIGMCVSVPVCVL